MLVQTALHQRDDGTMPEGVSESRIERVEWIDAGRSGRRHECDVEGRSACSDLAGLVTQFVLVALGELGAHDVVDMSRIAQDSCLAFHRRLQRHQQSRRVTGACRALRSLHRQPPPRCSARTRRAQRIETTLASFPLAIQHQSETATEQRTAVDRFARALARKSVGARVAFGQAFLFGEIVAHQLHAPEATFPGDAEA